MILSVSAVPTTLFAADATVYVGFQDPSAIPLNPFLPYLVGSTGIVVGARIATGGRFAFEQSVGYSPNFEDAFIDSFNTQSNLVVRFPVGKVTPYGTAGVGLIKTWGASGREFGTRFTVNYGGGIKFNRVVGPLGVRVDVRGYTAPNIPFRNEIGEVVVKYNLNFIEGTIGVVYSW